MNFAIFRKPSRYIGNEINIIRKDPVGKAGEGVSSNGVRVALCFPDTYEIGMSHMGLKILYSIINDIPHASAERAYAPWMDLESYLRGNSLPLTSLEHQRPLKDFDIVGFTLQYELSYTNILNMLDLGGIPLRADERGDNYPLVIAGGPCSVNPLPLAPFIDAFVIGDGEEVIKEIVDLFYEVKSQKSEVRSIKELLSALAKLEGVYVPCVHDSGKLTVKRRIVDDLDMALFPDKPLLPFTAIVHDRVAIEIARGCTKGCRFCQAGMIYRPLRERSLENILTLAQNSIINTGYEEISFTSLSTGDYSNLLPLIRTFNRQCAGSHVSVSLPSLRVGSINSEILKEIKSVRKTGFTIAPEAGTKKLRDVINKDFTEEEYEETLKRLFTEGWMNVKLYFMIGLPTETMSDIDGLIDMAVKALKKGREITGRPVNVNVGISAFVPKPHTPFQWTGQNSTEDLRKKQDYIRRAFRKKGINFKGQHVELSLLEALFSRADKDSALLLEAAWRLGCRFDGWSELFNFDSWLLAAEKTGINLYDYATRTFETDDELPWDFIDTGIKKDFLKSEYKKAMNEKITADCREVCTGCGLACNEIEQDSNKIIKSAERREKRESPGSLLLFSVADKINVPARMRVKFSKTDLMRYLSHHELMTAIMRAVRRAGIPVAYTAGFHPHPKVSFGPALPSGVEGLDEYFDIDMTAYVGAPDFLKSLNTALPAGLDAVDAALIPVNEKSLNTLISRYDYTISVDKPVERHIHYFMRQQYYPVPREKKTVDIRPMVENAEIKDNTLFLSLVDTGRAKVRLFEILREMLQATTDEIYRTEIKRTGLYGYNNDIYFKPLEDIGISSTVQGQGAVKRSMIRQRYGR